MFKNQLKFFVTLSLLLCFIQACPLQPELRKLNHKITAQIEKTDIANRPPWDMESYHMQSSPPVDIILSLASEDKYGNKRIQLFVYNQKRPNAAFYWKLIERYQGEYDVVWFTLTSHREDVFEPRFWLNQGVWYASHIPNSLVHPGFSVAQEQKGLHLQYAY